MGKLTDTSIRCATASDKAFRLGDGDGLSVVVMPTGAKLFWLSYRFGGKQKTLSLGQYGTISLKDARQLASEARRKIAMGVDVSEEKQRQRQEARDATMPAYTTFREVCESMLKLKATKTSEKYITEHRRSLDLHLHPLIGHLDVEVIDAPVVLEAAERIQIDGLYLAKRMIQRAGEVLSYAIAVGKRKSINPINKSTYKLLQTHDGRHNPAISIGELPALLADIREYRAYPITKLLFRFVLLTACRTGEAREMQWNWVDLEKRMITVPPEFFKTGRKLLNSGRSSQARPHMIPISEQVAEILRQAQELSSNSAGGELVFPSYRSRHHKASENVLLHLFKVMANGKWAGRQSGHGLRSIARTAWGESGQWGWDAMELQLAHSVGNATSRAYDQSERLDERRRMLQWWADQVDLMER